MLVFALGVFVSAVPQALAGESGTLSSLTVSAGTLTPTFDPAIFSYTDVLPYNTTVVPTVSASTTSVDATEVITQATNTTGSATVVVSDTSSTQNSTTYTVTFSLAPIPAPVWSASADLVTGDVVSGGGTTQLTSAFTMPAGGTYVQIQTPSANPFSVPTANALVPFVLTSTGGVDLASYYKATYPETDWTTGWGQYFMNTLPTAGASQTAMFYIVNGGTHSVQSGPQRFKGVTAPLFLPGDLPSGTYTVAGDVNGTTLTVTFIINNPNGWTAPVNPVTPTSTASSTPSSTPSSTIYTLNYGTDGNGTITGSSTQNVASGTDGSAVTAMPNDGFQFASWSDSSTANPRTDTDVTSSISVVADFSSIPVTPIPNIVTGGGGGGGGGGGSFSSFGGGGAYPYTILIDGGATTTTSSNVTLTLGTISTAAGNNTMWISNDPSFATSTGTGWIPFQKNYPWILNTVPAGVPRTVYVRFGVTSTSTPVGSAQANIFLVNNQGQVLGASAFNFNVNLHFGICSSDVIQLQDRLTQEGLYSGPITGCFGRLTLAAVKAYQKKYGISATGFVGPLTRAQLNKINGI